MIQIFTDGASRGNPGPGGYGTILKYKQFEKELTAGYRRTTNNRMELLAVIAGLEALKTENIPVTIYSDSKYVVDAVEKKWVFGWQKKGFAGKANADLWTRFLPLYRKFDIKFVWLKGHAGHPENERCDQMAVESALSPNLLIDYGYEAAEKLTK
ncbi:ribonuclease HI [Adhaeribacter arboris]|uniref:ribonuclease H n=1 Tax=Adhaeribacter arboris TaxID=2072846 RepID=A0A2T2YCV1_9BACT|nr:ribonuclease HI [Adhaeribacter arboris]PSR53350.1 ribonuclease HI [Adhaeribacter arboris]